MGPAILLPDGRIAISDNGDAVIRFFHTDGTFDFEIGGRGEGPGEFQYISRIAVLPPDTLVIHDSRLYRLSRFLTSGDLVSTLSLQAEGGRPEVYLGELSSGELVFSWIRAEARDTSIVTPDVMEFGKFDPSGHLGEVIGSHPGMRRKRSPVAFSPHLFAGLVGDTLFLTDGGPPAVQVWDSTGAWVRSVEIPLPVVEESGAWQALEEEVRSGGRPAELRSFESDPREDGIPRIGKMLFDDQNRLWVKEFDPRTDNHLLFGDRATGGGWIIITTNGEVLGRIDLPAGFLLQDVRGRQVLGRTTDSLGIQQVRVYDLIESR